MDRKLLGIIKTPYNMNTYKFSQAQIKIDELIESEDIKAAEQSLIQLEE